MPTQVVYCWWMWSGILWGRHPSFPDDCPPGKTCAEPADPGVFIGDEATTPCE